MSSREEKISSALALSQRTGTNSVMSMMKALKGTDKSSRMLRMFVKNVHLSVVSRKEEEDLTINRTGNSSAAEQREGAEPVLKIVRIAVKPPTSKRKGNEWDEMINWEPNSKKWEGGLGNQPSKKVSLPAFITKEVPYEVWRKHYAKNKYGRYRGTGTPAEDCILVPEDEEKWRSPKVDEETNQSTQTEEVPADLEAIKRMVTLPGYEAADPMSSSQSAQDSAVPIQKEEVIFVERDGHTAVQTVEAPTSPVTSPVSPTLPASLR